MIVRGGLVILEYNYITSYTSYTHGACRLLYSMWASFKQGQAKDIAIQSKDVNRSWRGKQDKENLCLILFLRRQHLCLLGGAIGEGLMGTSDAGTMPLEDAGCPGGVE